MNLSSGVHSFPVGDSSVSVYLPDEDVGVRGIWFGDPCSQPGFVGCIHFANDTMEARLPRLINALSNDTDYRVKQPNKHNAHNFICSLLIFALF